MYPSIGHRLIHAINNCGTPDITQQTCTIHLDTLRYHGIEQVTYPVNNCSTEI